MKSKFYEQEVDLETGDCKSTLASKLSIIQSKLKQIKNPYIGNKRKLITQIVKTLDKHDIKYNSILDLFSGSAYVSMCMKLLDKKVISNDILLSSYFNAVAYIENKDIELSNDDKNFLFFNRKHKKYGKFINHKYLKNFSSDEIKIFEHYSFNVSDRFENDPNEKIKSALAFVSFQNYILEKCFLGGRLNHGQILANYRHRIDHLRNKGKEMFYSCKGFSYEKMEWVKPLYNKDNNNHKCYHMDALSLLKNVTTNVDLCYIDPPYGQGQSNYLNMYRFFEEYYTGGFSIDDEKGYSRFINKNNYNENFEELIRLTSHIPYLAISYNNESWASVDKICEIIKRYRKETIVEKFSYNYKYRKNKSNTEEYLIIAKG